MPNIHDRIELKQPFIWISAYCLFCIILKIVLYTGYSIPYFCIISKYLYFGRYIHYPVWNIINRDAKTDNCPNKEPGGTPLYNGALNPTIPHWQLSLLCQNKCSAVAEMGDHLAKIDIGQKLGGGCPFSVGANNVA